MLFQQANLAASSFQLDSLFLLRKSRTKTNTSSLGRTLLGIWTCTVTPVSFFFFHKEFVCCFFLACKQNRSVIFVGNCEYLNVISITESYRCILPSIENCCLIYCVYSSALINHRPIDQSISQIISRSINLLFFTIRNNAKVPVAKKKEFAQ